MREDIFVLKKVIGSDVNIWKGTLKQWWSTIPTILTKLSRQTIELKTKHDIGRWKSRSWVETGTKT